MKANERMNKSNLRTRLVLTFWAAAYAVAAPTFALAEPPPESPTDPLVNPFRIEPPHVPGDAFVPSDNPEAAIPEVGERDKDQLGFGYALMELTDKAIAAFERKDYAEAVKFYTAIAKAVPQRAVAWSKLCESLLLMGDTVQAEDACRFAMERPGTVVADHTRFVELYLTNHQGPLKADVVARLDQIIAHVAERPEAAILAAQTACRLGARLEDAKRLGACTKLLNSQLPYDPLTISYSWALAVAEHDESAAERELARAEAAGLPATALATMRDRGMKLVKRARFTALGWALGAMGLAALAALGVNYTRRRKAVAHV